MFFRDNLTEVWTTAASKNYDFDEIGVIHCENLHPYLYAIFCDATKVCSLLNKNTKQPLLDFISLEEIFVSICYRLLRFIPIHPHTGRIDSQSALGLGLLIFTMTTFFQANEKRIMDFKALCVRFEDLLRGNLSGFGDEISLWLLALGGIWFQKELVTDHVASKMRNLCSLRKIYTWVEFRACISKFPWITVIHDCLGEELWNQTQRMIQ